MKSTRALRRISNLKKRIWGIQGGQGAGKTYSILKLLINHASSKPGREIYVASAELSKMRDTCIKDFINIINFFGIDHEMTGVVHGQPRCDFPNKSFIRFIGLDKEDVGKGLRSHIMFVNEANKTNFNTYRELTSRANRIIIDFNPNKKFWFHTEVQPREDCEFLKLTYLDNECLGQEERNEILGYKKRGYAADGVTVINQYWANMWRVYGLGEVGEVEGRIYNWEPIEYSKYLSIDKEVYYASDWGKVDPWAIVEMKYSDGNLYVHELNYASENEIERELPQHQLKHIRGGETDLGDGSKTDGLVSWMFTKLAIGKNKIIVCDSNRQNKIKTLRKAGWEYAVGVGGKFGLEERVGVLSALNIYYTSTSKNIETEQETYCYEKDKAGKTLEKPVDQDNHTLDAIAYGVQKLFELGVIKHL